MADIYLVDKTMSDKTFVKKKELSNKSHFSCSHGRPLSL